MNRTPPPEKPETQTHRVDAITDSSGRIQDDEAATVQPQDSIFQMTEAELDEFREDSLILFQPQVRPPPEEPQTLPRSNPRPRRSNPRPRPFTDEFTDSSGRLDFRATFLAEGQLENIPSPETHSVDSSGRIQDDEPATVQPQDSIFQMTEAESSGRLHINAILEPPIVSQPQDMPPPPEPPTRRLPRPMSPAELDEFRDSSGRIDFNAVFLSQGLPPPFLLQDVPPPPEPHRLLQNRPRRMSLAELDEFRDSSGRIDFNAVYLSQGLEPPSLIQNVPPPPEPYHLLQNRALLRRLPRPLSPAELDEFRDSSGRIDYNAVFLSQGVDPPFFLQGLSPPTETPIRLGYQSEGLSEETISKYLKTMNADELRAHNEDGDRKTCAVCLDDVCGQKDLVAILDDCGHEFHYCCLKKWLRRKNLCPLCRRTAIFLLGDDR